LLNSLFYLLTIKHTPKKLQQNTKKDQNKAIYHKVLAEQLRIPLYIQASIPTPSKLVITRLPFSKPLPHRTTHMTSAPTTAASPTQSQKTNKQKIKSDD
jgi:hypothetical protein